MQVAWNQHKPSATYTFNFPPMSLAMNGRDGTGTYQIGSFTNNAQHSATHVRLAIRTLTARYQAPAGTTPNDPSTIATYFGPLRRKGLSP